MARYDENKVVADHILKTEKNLGAALRVAAVMNAVKLHVAVGFTRELIMRARNELRPPLWKMEDAHEDTGRHVGVWFWRRDWRETWIGFKSYDMKRVGGVGLYNEERHACPHRAELALRLDEEIRRGWSNKWWAWSDNVPERFADFDGAETTLELYKCREALDYYLSIIVKVARVANDVIPVRSARRSRAKTSRSSVTAK